MAFPTHESVTETTFASDTTTHNVSMPATVNAGDVLVCLFSNDGAATVTTPGGWTQESSTANGASGRLSVYSKTADGSEGGTTVDFVTSANEKAAAQVHRYSGAHGDVEVGTPVTGSTASQDPPSLSPSWGSADTAWLAVVGRNTTATVSSYPTDYANGLDTQSGLADNTHAQVASARRNNATATEDPGAFTMSAAVNGITQTVAIRPGAAAAEPLKSSPNNSWIFRRR